MAYATYAVLLSTIFIFLHHFILHTFFSRSTLRHIPGPILFSLTKWRLAWEELLGNRTRKIHQLHKQYGPVVRIGPNEISFNSLSAMKTIFGPGSGFERTSFYDLFDVYGRKNLFTFHDSHSHAERKRLLAHAYSKSAMLKGSSSKLIEEKVSNYLEMVEGAGEEPVEIFSNLHYFALDAISEFLYGKFGKTECMLGNAAHRGLLNDIVNLARRKLFWLAVHFPRITKWLYSRTGLMEKLVDPLRPMKKPTTYTGIRAHGLRAWENFKASSEKTSSHSIMRKLWAHHRAQTPGGLDDMDIASECADHLLAGIDTTSDTLLFLVWALSRPEGQSIQTALARELKAMLPSELNDTGVPNVDACDKLPFLDAIVKETLRLYAPLPATEPRVHPGEDVVIDGYLIPAGTVVGIAPYSLHRNEAAFPKPLVFDPFRWIKQDPKTLLEMKRWFWAFSSGPRMCIGVHLALAEIKTLTAALYRNFHTSLTGAGDAKISESPGITSRFEVFYDEAQNAVAEHECWIRFARN